LGRRFMGGDGGEWKRRWGIFSEGETWRLRRSVGAGWRGKDGQGGRLGWGWRGAGEAYRYRDGSLEGPVVVTLAVARK